MENRFFNLQIGCSVKIERSDGRIHQALITAIDYSLNYVRVEWFEGNELKGKDVDFGSIFTLNSDKIFSKSDKPKIQSFIHPGVALGLNMHTRSMRSCLTQSSVDNSNISSDHEELVVIGKQIQYLKSSLNNPQQSIALEADCKLIKNRLEIRKRRAETKTHNEELQGLNHNNINWILQNMISEYCSRLTISPLSESDIVERHLITVCVRKRPLNEREIAKSELDIVTVVKKDQLIIHEPRSKVDLTRYLENHFFNFDYIFNESCTNAIVYKYSAQPLIKTIIEGGFATCFAYGQTGSGKTYTMCGNTSASNFGISIEDGIYAMVAKDIFRLVNSTAYCHLQLVISASFFEVYSNKILDLLNKKVNLKILEDSRQHINVIGLTEKVVGSVDEVLKLIHQGNNARTSGQTSFNSNSSRSHAVFQIYLRSAKDMTRLHGKFSLVDLAGNERGADSTLADKQTRLEGAEINKSLLALKECIRALGRKGARMPFRVSKLTQILRDSFTETNNSRTCMIAMVSPNLRSCEQTLNTLRYADRLKEFGDVEGHITPSAEQYLPSLQVKCPLLEKKYESVHYNSTTTLHSPNDLELRVAEKKLIDKHVEVLGTLTNFVEEVKCLLNLVQEDNFDPKEYSYSLEYIIDSCLTPLLITKELIIEYKKRINTDKDS